jgi:hypothetical protein
MFVTDTVDAIYPPDSWLPQAIMDRLGDILSDPHTAPSSTTTTNSLSSAPIFASSPTPDLFSSPSASTAGADTEARRPLLAARRINSIAELEPFFATVSLSAYESVYRAGARVDWEAVERTLERDLFEGVVR